MALRLRRERKFVAVPTTGTQLTGSNPGRRKVIISPPAFDVSTGVNTGAIVNNADTSTGGTKLQFTVPANVQGRLDSVGWFLTAGAAPTIIMSFTRGGVGITMQSLANGVPLVPNLPLQAGDIITLDVGSTGAGSTADMQISVTLDRDSMRVSINFGGPATLDQDLTIFPGGPPMVLDTDEMGESMLEAIFAISAFGTPNVVIQDFFA